METGAPVSSSGWGKASHSGVIESGGQNVLGWMFSSRWAALLVVNILRQSPDFRTQVTLRV